MPNEAGFVVRDTVRDQLVMNDGHAQETLKALAARMATEGAIFRQGEGDSLRGVVIRTLTQAEIRAQEREGIWIPPAMVLPARLTAADVQDFAEQRFTVIKFRKKPGSDDYVTVPADFRDELARRLIGSRLQSLRPLLGVSYAPILRRDGSIVATLGYDAATQLWLVDGMPALDIPDVPTRQDAEVALDRLNTLLKEHRFERDVDAIAAVAMLMVPALRASMERAPMLIADAAYPRTGKDYLIGTAALIGTGFKPTVVSLGEAREEQQKRIGAALLLGAPVVSLNNINGRLASDELAAYLTEGGCITRAYATVGGAKFAANGNVIVASGNNIMLGGDLPERGLIARQDARMENPGERQFNGKPHDAVQDDRGHYLSAIFTLARWALRGTDYTPPALDGFSGFDDFNRLIRGPLMALTGIDPLHRSRDEMQTERQERPDRELIDALTSLMQTDAPFNVREIRAELRSQSQQEHLEQGEAADPWGILRSDKLQFMLRRARGRRGSTKQLLSVERPKGASPSPGTGSCH